MDFSTRSTEIICMLEGRSLYLQVAAIAFTECISNSSVAYTMH